MRYDDQDRESSNVEDRRGQSGGGMFRFPGARGGGRRMQIPIPMGRGGGRGGFSITTLIIIGVVMWMLGFNPLKLLTGGGLDGSGVPDVSQMPQMPKFDRPTREASGRDGGGLQIPYPRGQAPANQPARADDQLASFTKKVLADTEDVWQRVFRSFGREYQEPKLVIFSGSTRTACGMGQSAMGPFYCPLDQKIYLDMQFYQELQRKFRAPGDFAQAYVIAHEVGHHVQNLLGITTKMEQARGRVSEREYNALSVRLELQADCFAGIWAHHNDKSKGIIEPGDVEEAMNAAAAIGDDALQRKSQGMVVPDSFTHGTSDQRQRWFNTGLRTGQVQACDTFNARTL